MGVKGLSALQRQVRDMRDDLDSEVKDAVGDAVDKMERGVQAQVVQADAVWTTNLYRSIYQTDFTMPFGHRFKIYAGADYAPYVEFGTGTKGPRTDDQPTRTLGIARGNFGTPRFDSPSEDEFSTVFGNIMQWVMTKPGFAGARHGGTAAAITEEIIENGTAAHPFMRPAYFNHKHAVTGYASAAVERAIR